MRYVVAISFVLLAVTAVALSACEPMPSETANGFAKIRPAIVEVQSVASDGDHRKSIPGVVVGPEGRVVSPFTEAESDAAFFIVAGSSRSLGARAIHSDRNIGCVVLQADFPTPSPSASFTEGRDVAVGDSALVIEWASGSPEPTCSRVIVSRINHQEEGRDKVLQLDSAIGSGVGAGILINLDGQPIGVVRSGGKVAIAVHADRVAKCLAGIPSTEDAEPRDAADSR